MTFPRTYWGTRTPAGCEVRVTGDGPEYLLPTYSNVRDHSHDFEWGYNGSGPAQLALALLSDAFGDESEIPARYYQRFKADVVAGLDRASWVLQQRTVLDHGNSYHLEQIEQIDSTATKRADSLRKARAARRDRAERRKKLREELVYCIAPHGEPLDGTYYTLHALHGGTKKYSHLVTTAGAVNPKLKKKICDDCRAVLLAWKTFGPNKPLTYRRLNTWHTEESIMEAETKTRREVVLEKAIGVLNKPTTRCEKKSIAMDFLIGLLADETARRKGRADVVSTVIDGARYVTDHVKARKALHLELVKLGLPPEVIAVLTGA